MNKYAIQATKSETPNIYYELINKRSTMAGSNIKKKVNTQLVTSRDLRVRIFECYSLKKSHVKRGNRILPFILDNSSGFVPTSFGGFKFAPP